MKNAEIDNHIQQSSKKTDKHGHVFLFPQQQRRKNRQKGYIKNDIIRRKLSPCDYFGHISIPPTRLNTVYQIFCRISRYFNFLPLQKNNPRTPFGKCGGYHVKNYINLRKSSFRSSTFVSFGLPGRQASA